MSSKASQSNSSYRRVKALLFSPGFQRFVLAMVAIVITHQFLLSPEFSLIDDGVGIQRSMKMEQSYQAGDYGKLFVLEKKHGRVRPMYWIYVWLRYIVFGKNSSFLYHLWQTIFFIIILQLIYSIASLLFSSKSVGLLSGLLFALFSPGSEFTRMLGSAAENWWRWASAEPQLTFLYILSFFFFLKAYIIRTRYAEGREGQYIFYFIMCIIILPIFYFTKETSLFFIPVSALFLAILPGKERRGVKALLWSYFVANAICGIVLLFFVVPVMKQGYAGGYEIFNFDRHFKILRIYLLQIYQGLGLLLIVALVGFIARVISEIGRKKFSLEVKWEFLLLCSASAVLIFIVPWESPLPRYLSPCLVSLTIFVGCELDRIFKSLGKLIYESGKRGKKFELQRVMNIIFLVFLICCCIFLFHDNLKIIFRESSVLAEREKTNGEFIRYIADKVPHDGRVLLSYLPGLGPEWTFETGLHLKILYGRDDIKVDFFDPQKPNDLSGNFFFATWFLQQFGSYERDQNAVVRALWPRIADVKEITKDGVKEIKIEKERRTPRFIWRVYEIKEAVSS